MNYSPVEKIQIIFIKQFYSFWLKLIPIKVLTIFLFSFTILKRRKYVSLQYIHRFV